MHAWHIPKKDLQLHTVYKMLQNSLEKVVMQACGEELIIE